MILFALSIIASSINDDHVFICFYDVNTSLCPPFAYSYSVSNFSEFILVDIPTSEQITFEFHAPTSLEDVINISRFDESKLKKLEFIFRPDESLIQPEFLLTTTDKFVPSEMFLDGIKPTLDFNTNFTKLSLFNSPLNIPDNYIIAENLDIDTNSLKNVNTITADSIMFRNVFGDQTPRSFAINSFSDNSTLQFIDISSTLLKASIVLSKLLFENQHNTSIIAIDFSNWNGNVTIKYGSITEVFMTLECLAHSPKHHFPFLSINFANQLQLPESNWPNTTEPIIEISAMNIITPFPNKIIISGFIPAHIMTGTTDLTISPTIFSSGFMKLTVQNSNLSISQPFLFSENYYFFINELATARTSGNTTIIADPPLMYISIDRFSDNLNSKSEFQLLGTANYILKSLPTPHDGFAPTIYAEHLWFENNVTFNFNLDDGVPNIRVLDFVLMKTWPTYFIPVYNGHEIEGGKAVDQKKFKLICAKLLKEQKEEVMLPPSGLPRGFNRGASIVHSYYEQDPESEQTLKCFSLDIHGDTASVSNVFCLADDQTKDKCPQDSQYVPPSGDWRTYAGDDAGELTFHAYRSAELAFANFSMVNVTVIGYSSEKVNIKPEGVDHLRLTGVDANVVSNNCSVHIELTNAKLTTPDGKYELGPLVTDPVSLKSIASRDQFTVQVTVKDVPDTKITVSKDGSVTFEDSGVTFHSKIHQNDQNATTLNDEADEDVMVPASLILINKDVSSVAFTFEEGSGESIANNSIIAKFSSSADVSFVGLPHASRFFVLDGFSGTLDFGQETTVPIDLINGHDINIKTSATTDHLTFQSELDLAGSFNSDVVIQSNNVRVMPGSVIAADPTIKADHFVVLENAEASLKSLSVTNSLDVFPGGFLDIRGTEELPGTLTVHYNLENLPSIVITSPEATSKNKKITDKKYVVKKIIFSYEDDKFNTAIMNRTSLFSDGIEIIGGSGFDCSSASYEFVSSYVYYHGIYSLIQAKCVDNAVKLFINQNSATPPAPTPVPLIPTATPVPNNTREQVVIISMTVVTFFLIIVIVIIKCMNRKKKYVSKKQDKDLSTQPMLSPNEGNAE